jgi:hypothetical protein
VEDNMVEDIKDEEVGAYYSKDLLEQVDSNRLVVSSMFEKIFIPSKRAPAEIVERFSANREELAKALQAEIPLTSTILEKPYWGKGKNVREFDQVKCDIFGAICLADDRHLLDSIIAHGALIEDADKLTLRQVTELAGIVVDWNNYLNKPAIDSPLLNRGIYFHVRIKDLCVSMGVKNEKRNREQFITRLNRLSLMALKLEFYKDGESLNSGQPVQIRFVDHEIHKLLVPSSVKNKKTINSETFTDIIVNVNSYYVKTLEMEGQISRKRFLETYSELSSQTGNQHSFLDFLKFLDSHDKEFLSKKTILELIGKYFDDKISLYGMNRSYKIKAMYKMVEENKELIYEFFGFLLILFYNPKTSSEDFRMELKREA